jgi:murein DD-endopeptidase MepM/ murein hydrolase activator NlpD
VVYFPFTGAIRFIDIEVGRAARAMGEPRWGGSGLSWLSLPLGGLLAFVVAVGVPWDEARVVPTALESASLHPQASFDALAAEAPAAAAVSAEPRPARAGALRSGQTLGGLLGELGLAAPEVHAAAEASRRWLDPRQLKPGARWAAFYGDPGLTRFDLALEGRGAVSLARRAGGWDATFREYRRETRLRTLSGSLDGALESAIERAGGDPALAFAMADVLQWDLDFNRDLQPGDRFRILFEEIWLEGAYHGLGRVLGLTYGHDTGRLWEAYRFGTDGFYDGEGRPLQKLFLRSPLPYSRITSRFSNRRFHPVLKVFRPHHGVDYGAPTGTPVRVTASGTVTFAGWDGGGGRTVKVRHPNGYLTCYLHLSKFARDLRAGARVRQGDVVGFVGSTGLATAPHLDYRVQRNGRWIDPLALGGVPAEPLSRARLAEFQLVRAAMRESLETGRPYAPVAAGAGAPEQVAGAAAPVARARR